MVSGLDVHKRSVYATAMEDNVALIVQRNMENNIEVVNGFLFNYRDHDIVIESSTSGKYLSKELSMLGYKVHLINPAKVPEIANNCKKTDREDSFQLADVFRKGGMKEIYILSGDIENVRSLVRYRHSLGGEITLKKNKAHALLTSYGIIIKATDPFGKKGLREIENNYNNLNYSDKIVLRSLIMTYHLLRKDLHHTPV
ncbi:MAG: transposase [Ferroplasma sp.]|uniref:IS110 family transposase n=1 Tax=Ferroplasma sp. TaxID=2591003 RepID=UPI002815B12F|nr:transposase [Ferroplasma sp.]WMT50855.1 MAG: transposase [Ferroplasma sp.]